MRQQILSGVAAMLLLPFSVPQTTAQDATRLPEKAAINFRVPAREFESVEVGGREFTVEKQLLVEAPSVADRVLRRMNENINLCLRILPPHSHEQIAKQRFWLMYGSKATAGGWDQGLAYFRPGSPKYDERRHQDWNSVIVVFSAENYMKLTDLWALKSMLHEMAHAYQLEQWPEKQPEILKAWQNTVDQKLYRNVKDNKGKTLAAAYATTNQLEYFSELSCMFFARCNYPPFQRLELRVYDPVGYEMIRKMWRIGDEHGTREERVWQVGTRRRALNATLKEQAGSRVRLIDEKGRTRTYSLKALSPIDQDHVAQWFETTGTAAAKR